MQDYSLKYFKLQKKGNKIDINEIAKQKFNDDRFWYRSAKVSSKLPVCQHGSRYQDSFKIKTQGKDYNNKDMIVKRLFQLFDYQTALFQQKEYTFIEQMSQYPTFLTQFGLIDPQFIKSLFFTQQVNEQGYYKYFVRRNGQYYVETVDDSILINSYTNLPIWGLSLQSPWHLILLKAWIKQKGSLENVKKAEPFEFIHAFGLPAYKIYNFKKQYEYITRQKETQLKISKIKNSRLNQKKNQIMIGKTRNSEKINQMGLQKNRVAYKIIPIQDGNQISQMFFVQSTVLSKWVGAKSLFADLSLKTQDIKNHNVNLETKFLMERKQLLEIFNIFYIAKNENYFQAGHCQSSYELSSERSHQLKFKVHSFGRLAIKIQLPESVKTIEKGQKGKNNFRYPKIKYFLSKIVSEQMMKNRSVVQYPQRPQLRSRLNLQKQQFIHTEVNLYDCYDMEYGTGYHHSLNQFVSIEQGQYIIHVKAQKQAKQYLFNLSLDSYARMSSLQYVNFTQQQKNNQFFASNFNKLSKDYGIQVSFHQQKWFERIKIGNTFDQLGYGFITIKTMKQANHNLVMRIFPRRLLQAGYAIKTGVKYKEESGLQKPLTIISQKGIQQTLVFRKIKSFQGETRFPPKGCVQFYRVIA